MDLLPYVRILFVNLWQETMQFAGYPHHFIYYTILVSEDCHTQPHWIVHLKMAGMVIMQLCIMTSGKIKSNEISFFTIVKDRIL